MQTHHTKHILTLAILLVVAFGSPQVQSALAQTPAPANPVITSINPSTTYPGGEITITGTGFSTTANANYIQVTGQQGTPNYFVTSPDSQTLKVRLSTTILPNPYQYPLAVIVGAPSAMKFSNTAYITVQALALKSVSWNNFGDTTADRYQNPRVNFGSADAIPFHDDGDCNTMVQGRAREELYGRCFWFELCKPTRWSPISMEWIELGREQRRKLSEILSVLG